ncbi:MAG: terpene cyclase/mutase family protein [Planctomycetes bacterium]|nr:terpene cyclase/mutase family protein [Planctomycetota bacterium]
MTGRTYPKTVNQPRTSVRAVPGTLAAQGKPNRFRIVPWTMVTALVLVGYPAGRVAGGASGLLPRHVTPQTQAAIDRGLAYLVRNQGPDGAWRNEGGYGRYPVAMSALAGLALLMDGNTTTQGRYARQVDEVTRFLVESSNADGLIARGDGEGRPMYGHGFGMLFLSQLYGTAEDPTRQEVIGDVLRRGVELIARSQSSLGGWYYRPTDRTDEGSVTVTQVQALRSCRNAGIAVPREVIDSAMNYLALSARSDGGIAYRASMRRGSSRPAITAAAVCCWFNAGEYDHPLALRGLEYCKANISVGEARQGHYYYAHLYLAQALYLAGPDEWDHYFPPMRDRLVATQYPDGHWHGAGVGTTYGTSIALIILQLPHSRLPIMQR